MDGIENGILSDPSIASWYLRKAAADLCSFDNSACSKLLDIPNFTEFPASISKHHVWVGGLVQHTAQVYSIAMRFCDAAEASGKPMNRNVVACASIFHDAGKLYDYEKINREPNSDQSGFIWAKTNHFDLVHHVVKSSEMWDQLSGFKDNEFGLSVKHAILAHHGRLEWGSPILPKTREAWAVHLADMASVHCIELRKP